VDDANVDAGFETLRIEVQIPVVVGGYHIPRAADPDKTVITARPKIEKPQSQPRTC